MLWKFVPLIFIWHTSKDTDVDRLYILYIGEIKFSIREMYKNHEDPLPLRCFYV